jgi:hypothetical protein
MVAGGKLTVEIEDVEDLRTRSCKPMMRSELAERSHTAGIQLVVNDTKKYTRPSLNSSCQRPVLAECLKRAIAVKHRITKSNAMAVGVAFKA